MATFNRDIAAFGASEPTIAAEAHPAESVLPQLVRREGLDGGEDDVVDAGPEHEEDPMGEAQRVLGRRQDGLAETEQQELDEPRDEVARAGDGVLARALHGQVAPARGEHGGGAPVEFSQFSDDDEEEDKFNQVCQETECGANVIEYGLELR